MANSTKLDRGFRSAFPIIGSPSSESVVRSETQIYATPIGIGDLMSVDPPDEDAGVANQFRRADSDDEVNAQKQGVIFGFVSWIKNDEGLILTDKRLEAGEPAQLGLVPVFGKIFKILLRDSTPPPVGVEFFNKEDIFKTVTLNVSQDADPNIGGSRMFLDSNGTGIGTASAVQVIGRVLEDRNDYGQDFLNVLVRFPQSFWNGKA